MQSAQETIPSAPLIPNRHDANVPPSDTPVSSGGSILLLLGVISSLVVYATRKKDFRTIWTQSAALSDIFGSIKNHSI